MRDPRIWIAGLLVVLVAFVAGYVEGRGFDVFGSPASASLEQSTRKAMRTTPLDRRGEALIALFEDVGVDDLDAITRAYEGTHIGLGPGALDIELLGELWARLDPAGGVRRSKQWREFWSRQLLPPLMRAWSRVDPKGARAAASAIEDEKMRSLAESSITLGRFSTGIEAAWQAYQQQWPVGAEVYPEVAAMIAAREGLPKLFDRLESLPDDAPELIKGRGMRIAAALGGRLDPTSTTSFVTAHADDEIKGLKNLIVPFVDAWSEVDSRAALDWLMTQPASGRRSIATRIAFRPWILSAETRLEAIEWIEAQPESVLDPVRDYYAMALLHVDHARAIEAAEQIKGPNRDTIVRRVKKMVEVREKRDQKARRATASQEASL